MREVIEKNWKFLMSGLAIFIIGIFVGSIMGANSTKMLDDVVFRALPNSTSSNATSSNATSSNATSSNATSSNATSSNATSSNATSSNATNSNATNSNATSSNYRQSYNLLMLSDFSVLDNDVTVGERDGITLSTYGACLSGAILYIKKADDSFNISLPVKSITDSPYVIIPSDIPSGSYYVEKILAIGRNYDDSTFSVTFNGEKVSKEVINVKNNESNIILNKIELGCTTCKVGEKVDVLYSTSEPVKSLKLLFKKENGTPMEVYLKSLNESSFFMIPSIVEVGEYKLNEITLITDYGLKIYSIDSLDSNNKLNDVIVLNVVEGSNSSYIYDNNSIEKNNDVLNKIYVAPESVDIYINAESNSLIDEKVFNTIKGTNKKLVIGYEDNQIIFNGEDIETPKSIDASIEVRDLSENSIISKVVSDGVIISFSDNGNLPGKANIRIKSNKLLDNVIGDKKAYIYKYNEVTNDFTEIDSNVTLTEEGYYEFTINHNSDYVLVTKKIDKKYLSESEKIVSFQRGDRTNIALIVFGILLIIGVSIAIFFLKNNSKSTVVKEEEIDKKTKKPKKKEIKK